MAAKLNHVVNGSAGFPNDAAANAYIALNSWVPEPGWLYRDTTLGVMKIWNGMVWVVLGPAGGGVTQWVEQQIIYVGKHGNDASPGTAINQAKLTFTAALAAAAALVPSTTNRVAIVCFDAGTYVENVSMLSWVNLFAPNASVNGTVTLVDDSDVHVYRVFLTAPGIAVVKSAGISTSRFEAFEVLVPNNSVAMLNLGVNSVTMFEVKQVFVGPSSFGVGNLSSGQGHVHVEIEDVYLTGVGATAVASGTSGTVVGNITHILETGAGIGFGVGINILTGTANLSVEQINANVAYTVGVGATLNAFVAELVGAQIAPAGADARVVIARAVPVSGSGNPNGVATGYFGQTYFDATNSIWYKCDSQPTGVVWRVIG